MNSQQLFDLSQEIQRINWVASDLDWEIHHASHDPDHHDRWKDLVTKRRGLRRELNAVAEKLMSSAMEAVETEPATEGPVKHGEPENTMPGLAIERLECLIADINSGNIVEAEEDWVRDLAKESWEYLNVMSGGAVLSQHCHQIRQIVEDARGARRAAQKEKQSGPSEQVE